MTTFESLGIPSALMRSLEKRGITAPTPIQQMAIPVALTGKDLFASAATGSGKTIAYLIPVLASLMEDKDSRALILAPTRELAQQINDEIVKLINHAAPFKIALLIGGRPYFKQEIDLRKTPRFVVGTPGRVRDHLERGNLKLDKTSYFILDETDRMLDLGFSDDLAAIAKKLPAEKQTLMFSATMSPTIEQMSKKWLTDPVHLAADTAMQPSQNIKEESVNVTTDKKFETLLQALGEREGSVIVFVRTKIGAENLARKLRDEEHLAEAIHGDLPQRKRDRVIKSFRNQRSRIMVATDVASRGLDIPHIMHVINFDLPECAEDYIHRVGRTGRAGKEGFALSFISPEEKKFWRAIKKLSGGQDDDEREERGSRRGPPKGRRSFSGPRNGSWKPQRRFGGPREKRESFGEQRESFGDQRERRESFGGPREKRENFGGPRERRESFSGPRERRESFGSPRENFGTPRANPAKKRFS